MAVRDSSERARKRKDNVLTAVCAPGIGARDGHPFRVNYRIFTSISECTCMYIVVSIDQNFVVKVACKVVSRAVKWSDPL